MSDLLARLQRDLTAARKAQDRAATLLLGTVIADVKNREFELHRPLTDDDVHEVLGRAIKRRRESVELYERGRREDLAARERAEVTALEAYLPTALGEEEIRSAVRAALADGATTIGAVMGKVMPRLKGRADGARVNAIAREELSDKG